MTDLEVCENCFCSFLPSLKYSDLIRKKGHSASL